MRCPLCHRNCDARNVYQTFLQNVEEFRNLEALPVDLSFGPEFTADLFLDEKAKWHRSCHQKFTASRLQQAKDRKRKQDEDEGNLRCLKRQSLEANMPLCIFCGKQNSEKLHYYATRNAEVFLRTMASEMGHNEMFAKLSSGDLVATEAKYHFSCLTKYRNQYRSYLREKNKTTDERYEQAKARTFVELVSYIECAIEEGTYLFKIKELLDMYQNRLKDIGYDFEVNKNAFKESIL